MFRFSKINFSQNHHKIFLDKREAILKIWASVISYFLHTPFFACFIIDDEQPGVGVVTPLKLD